MAICKALFYTQKWTKIKSKPYGELEKIWCSCCRHRVGKFRFLWILMEGTSKAKRSVVDVILKQTRQFHLNVEPSLIPKVLIIVSLALRLKNHKSCVSQSKPFPMFWEFLFGLFAKHFKNYVKTNFLDAQNSQEKWHAERGKCPFRTCPP